MFKRIALAWWVLLAASPSIASEAKFIGEVVAKLAGDGRNMVLMQPFSYVDAQGRQWDVPVGTETDGASIPQAFWIAYPPFTGLYRAAAVIHDYYCQTQERTWQDTHNVFYDAMITSGVDQKTAKVMWGAVYYMGPRWTLGRRGLASNGPGPTSTNAQQQAIEKLDKWIAEKNPTREEIAAALEGGKIP